MDYAVLLNDEKISAEIKDLEVTDRYGSKADDIRLTIINNSTVDIKRGDSLACSFGGLRSGKMNIDQIVSNSRTTLVGAISAPTYAKEPSSRHWNKVRLFDIVNDVATNCGLSVYYEGVTNYLYENVTQFKETDLAFLNRLCTREGYSLKIDDNRIVIYKNSIIEGKPSVLDIGFSDVLRNRISFSENPNRVKSVTVKYFADRLISYTAKKDIDGGSVVKTEYVANEAEAERFAHGYLEEFSRNDCTVDVLLLLNDKVSAGNCVTLKDFGRYNGKYFINECCYDPVNDQMRILGRKIV